MTLVYVFAWWHLPLALAVLVLVLGLWWAASMDDGYGFNPVPAFVGCGTFVATAGLLVGALCAWLAGR